MSIQYANIQCTYIQYEYIQYFAINPMFGLLVTYFLTNTGKKRLKFPRIGRIRPFTVNTGPTGSSADCMIMCVKIDIKLEKCYLVVSIPEPFQAQQHQPE